MKKNGKFLRLLDGTVHVPDDYARDVGEIKRLLELWTIDPAFRDRYTASPQRALDGLDIRRTVEEISPFVCNDKARELQKAEAEGKDEGYPLSVRRYRHFLNEKLKARSRMREDIKVSDHNFTIWRKRQINRCMGTLGYRKADGIVHSPVSFELSSGCSVGCWFCALASEKLSDTWPYADANAGLWKDTLQVVKEVVGPGSKYGVCYWATEPFDNPDYEKYIGDFARILGRCPQTTTAAPTRDIPRLRRFLSLARELDSDIDRFSILSLKMLKSVHENFTPEELLRVELIPQNPEASSQYRKAYSGRTRMPSLKKSYRDLAQSEHSPSTIACITGFIISMPRRSVSLITPCPSNSDWPLGHWVLAKGTFQSADDLHALLTNMMDENFSSGLRIDDRLSFRDDLGWEIDSDDAYCINSPHMKLEFKTRPYIRDLLNLIGKGKYRVHEIAKMLERRKGADLHDVFLTLNELHQKGLFNEDPAFPQRSDKSQGAKP